MKMNFRKAVEKLLHQRLNEHNKRLFADLAGEIASDSPFICLLRKKGKWVLSFTTSDMDDGWCDYSLDDCVSQSIEGEDAASLQSLRANLCVCINMIDDALSEEPDEKA